jgi:hypothetical protein
MDFENLQKQSQEPTARWASWRFRAGNRDPCRRAWDESEPEEFEKMRKQSQEPTAGEAGNRKNAKTKPKANGKRGRKVNRGGLGGQVRRFAMQD